MPLSVALAVLAAAVGHAVWNAILRVRGERVIVMTLVTAFSALVVLPLAPFVPFPEPAAWGFLLLSVCIHQAYNVFLATAYGHGDLTRIYPLARGSAPLGTLAVGLLLGEAVGGFAVTGILLLVGGILLLALEGGLSALRRSPAAAGYGMATALCITAYTISDGHGARLAGSPHSYAVWLFVLDGIPLLLYVLLRRRRALVSVTLESWRPACLAGTLSLAAYWIVLWAMTKAPIPLVAALRETSVVFAMLIGIFILKERLTAIRVVSPLLVLTGLALMRLG